MVKELSIAAAEIVQSGIAVAVLREPVSWTFSMTYIQVFAFAALLRQCRFFIDAKGRLPWAVEHLRERLLVDVAQSILREYEVVAAIQVAVVLHHTGMTATLRHGAYTRRYACIVGQCGVKQLYEIRAYILPYPLIEQRTEKPSPLLGCDRERSQRQRFLIGQRCQMPTVLVALDTFHHGRKLDIVTAYLLEEMIECQRCLCIQIVDHRHRVPVHPVPVENLYASHHLRERWFSAPTSAIGIVKRLGTVYRHPHQHVVTLEECRPFIVNQRAVGLKTVVDCPPPAILLLQSDSLLVETDRAHQWFSSMPGKENLVHGLRLDILARE